jgi:RNA polymerase-binding transcription factor DksA
MKPQRHTLSSRSSTLATTTPARRSSETKNHEANTPNSGVHERIPPQWAWHYRTLIHLRERLMRAHAEHAAQAAAPAEMLGGDVVDVAQEQTDRDVLWAQLGNEIDQLFEVDCALQRIHDGTYGFCEKTGHTIPRERLRAVPWTRYALDVGGPSEQQSDGPKKRRL